MTDLQKVLSQALARVKLPPGQSVTSFAYRMAMLADTRPATTLTPKQHKFLCASVVRFQRQINPLIVERARQELARIALEEAQADAEGPDA